MLELSLKEARRLAIGAQLLAGKPPKRPTKQLMRDTIRHLGALQIDTINVVARSHHIVRWVDASYPDEGIGIGCVDDDDLKRVWRLISEAAN